MTGNINETAAESHQRLWGFSFGGGVDSHHLWFHFAAFSVTFPVNGRPSDPAVPDFSTFSATLVWVCHTLGAGNFRKFPANFGGKGANQGKYIAEKKVLTRGNSRKGQSGLEHDDSAVISDRRLDGRRLVRRFSIIRPPWQAVTPDS